MKKIIIGLLGLLFAVPAVADLNSCRNLFDKDNTTDILYTTPEKEGQIWSDMGVNSNHRTAIMYLKAGTYSFWADDSGLAITRRVTYYSTKPTYGTTGGTILINYLADEHTFTTTADGWVAIWIANAYVSGADNPTVRDKCVDTFTLIEGSVAPSSYIPYGHSTTPIKIATTAYNSARFSPVVTELNDTIATIRNVVTNTINQTKAIADLQATKQTRPNENCPAGKKCLLVEDDAGMPHWYEIVESAD